MADITPAHKLFDLLVSRDFDPEMLDATGRPSESPSETEIFSFDFRAESGKDYGTVVIMLGNDNELEVYCSDNVGRSMEGDDKNDWFDFLAQLKNFATRNFMSFGIKNLNRLRYSMQGQAGIKESVFESWAGKKDISWNAGATESRLMIKHKRALGEGEARFRCIESLFIETAEGERYKLPFRNLTAGKAMLEHVRAGGRPYDDRGQHISEMVTELNVLTRFRRANQGRLLEGDTAVLVEKTTAYYETLRHTLKSLTTRGGYGRYFESWNPVELTEESAVIDGLKHLFVTQSIDQRIEDALPLIARIQQQENAMKETEIFEAWADQLMEGTWQTPDTPEKQARLIELLSQDLPVGADATNATEQLYDLLGDDELFDQLQALADRDANADARQIVLNRMQELGQDPDVMKVITSLNIDDKYAMNPPEQTPADLDAEEKQVEEMMGGDASDEFIRDVSIDQQDQTMDEGEQLDELSPELLRRAHDAASAKKMNISQTGDMKDPNVKKAFDTRQQQQNKFADAETQKMINATGMEEAVKDPHTQTEDPEGTKEKAYPEYAEDLMSILKHAGVPAQERPAPDYEEEVAETANPGVTPADIDGVPAEELDEASRCNMTEAGESCPVHGLKECGMEEGWGLTAVPTAESALQGQYGHTGRMKPVAEDTGFLTRLKELSGMIRN